MIKVTSRTAPDQENRLVGAGGLGRVEGEGRKLKGSEGEGLAIEP